MRTSKYQIREHPQNKRLGNMLDDLCDVHNHFLALENRYYRRYGKYAGRYRLQPHLTKLLLKFKSFKHNREFHQVGQWTATTKPCSDCGHQNEKLSLSERQWTCPECDSHHDRDVNAAINILRAACDPVVEMA